MFEYGGPLRSGLGGVLGVEVDEVIKHLDVGHFDAGLLRDEVADSVDVVVDEYGDSLAHAMIQKATSRPQPMTMVM